MKTSALTSTKTKYVKKYIIQQLHYSTVTLGAALAPQSCHPHTAQTLPPRRSHAARPPHLSNPRSRCPYAAACSPHTALTQLHAAAHYHPNPLFALHNGPTPLQRRPHAAALSPRAAARSPLTALAPPSRSCTQLLTVPTPSFPHPPYFALHNAPCRCNAAVAPPLRSCMSHSRRPHAAPCCPHPHLVGGPGGKGGGDSPGHEP